MPETVKTAKGQKLKHKANRLKAIAHPMRLAIIELLRSEEMLNVTEIYTALGMEQAVASQHLNILKKQEILAYKKKGKHSYYYLKFSGVATILDILGAERESYPPLRA